MKYGTVPRACAFVFVLFFAIAALAQTQRTFVSSTGNDANPCSRTSPCRNFAAAVAAVLAGGEVIVLDSAGYGPVALNKGVSIVAPPGVYAGVSVFTGDGIDVNAPGALVRLRGLTINGLGGNYGVNVTDAASIYLESCTVLTSGFAAIQIETAAKTFIDDCVVVNNPYGAINIISTTPVLIHASVNRCRIDSTISAPAIYVSGVAGCEFIVRDTVADSCAVGFQAYGGGSLVLKNCVASSNLTGVQSDAGSSVTLSGCTIAGNSTGLRMTGGTISSYGNNEFVDNATPTSGGTVTPATLQ